MMGRSKALLLAGAVSLLGAAAAHAADLAPPPPEPLRATIEPIETSGWYIRGDIGVGINTLRQRPSTFQDKSYDAVANDVKVNEAYIGDSTFIRAGFGYQFNDWFRADVTGEYRTDAALRNVESYKNIAFPVNGVTNEFNGSCGATSKSGSAFAQDRCFDSYKGSIRSALFMANGYVDLGTWYRVTPYVGAGAGFATIFQSYLTDQAGNNTGFGYAVQTHSTNFAYALMAGLSYSVSRNLKLELGYRYLDQGSVRSNPIVCSQINGCHFEQQHYDLASHDLHLGMRWMLDGGEGYQHASHNYLSSGHGGGAVAGVEDPGAYGAGAGAYGAGGGYGAGGHAVVRKY